MPITINGSTGIAGVDGSASSPSYRGSGTFGGLFYPAANTVAISTISEALRITSDGNIGIGTTNTSNGKLSVITSGSGAVSLFQSDTSYQYLKVV